MTITDKTGGPSAGQWDHEVTTRGGIPRLRLAQTFHHKEIEAARATYEKMVLGFRHASDEVTRLEAARKAAVRTDVDTDAERALSGKAGAGRPATTAADQALAEAHHNRDVARRAVEKAAVAFSDLVGAHGPEEVARLADAETKAADGVSAILDSLEAAIAAHARVVSERSFYERFPAGYKLAGPAVGASPIRSTVPGLETVAALRTVYAARGR